MKITNNACPACASSSIANVSRVEKVPAILFPIEKSKRNDVATDDIVTASCHECGHVFLRELDLDFNSKLYGDYYYLYPFSALESMNAHYREPFNKIFDLFVGHDGGGRSLLEIGCSDERQFDAFLSAGFSCVGVSPGAQLSSRVEMIDAFYEQLDVDRTFDVVVSRFNLEHIISPSQYLEKICAELSPGGHLIVQVPNFQFYVESGILFPFAHEHPQYFTAASLRCVLERSGFQVSALLGPEAQSLIAVAEKPACIWNARERLKITNEVLVETVDEILALPQSKLVFYGAGLSLIGMLYSDGRIRHSSKEIRVVDDNSLLNGRFMPRTNLQLESFSENIIDTDTAVILALNPVYHTAVAEKVMKAKPGAVLSLQANGLQRLL
jgi:SAM-dependent methyltransferase